jgi:flagellar biosynthesis protein FliP
MERETENIMKRNLATIIFCALLLVFTLINNAYAAEESPINQFLGSPLLILTAIIIIDIIAFLYRKIRK